VLAALLAAAAWWIAPASAGAHTIIEAPDLQARTLWQGWVDASLIPTASVVVRVAGNQCDATTEACTISSVRPMVVNFPDTTYLWGPLYAYDTSDRLAEQLNFMHEMGHVRDFSSRRHDYRRRFKTIMGLGGGWLWGHRRDGTVVQPDEQFAMAFAYCSLYPHRPDWVIGHVYWGYDFYPTSRQYLQVCRLLDHLPV
jgi:hypothetical protein